MKLHFLLGLLAAAPAVVIGAELDAFSHADTEAARERWEPQFGSKPVRVERLEDGSTCIALDAEFRKAGDRACWDWRHRVDLSRVSRVSFEAMADNGGLGGNIGVYFGTPNGWYARFWWGGVPDVWTPRVFRLDSFGQEDKPDGWQAVNVFRFSVWSTGAGKATFRLRNLRTHRRDPTENFLRNGSFEMPGVGVPYAWGSGHWGVGALPWAIDMELWRRRWRLDSRNPRHGDACLLIDNSPDLPLQRACSAWVSLPSSVKKCTLSAWVRADQDGLPVSVSCGGRSFIAEARRAWGRIVLKNVPGGGRKTVVIAPKAPGKLWIDAVQLQECEQPTSEFHRAFVDDTISERERRVDWSAPRRTEDVAAGRSVQDPLKPAEVRIDESARFLVDGKPYVPHALGLEFVSDLAILDFAAKSGFRDVCVQVRPNLTTDELEAIFDRCGSVGLRIIPWLDGRMSRERFKEHVTRLRGHRALLCWYVYDEPSGERFAEADARYRMARELDPARPAYINYLANKLEDHTGDIYSTDVYPIPRGSPTAAINAVARMHASAVKERKPVWMWLQGTGYAYWMDREPSPRELSCMVYGSLIEGARGIFYFAQVPRTKQCFDEMRAMCVEVEALAPVVYSLQQAPAVEVDQPNILFKAFADGDACTVLAVNTQNTPCRVCFRLAGASGNVEVVFEGRMLGATDGAWQDEFGPYERHVYRLDVKQSAQAEP